MPRILDVSAGKRAVWFDKTHPDCLFVDVREQVEPDLVADSRNLPLEDASFELAVFDPPHVNFGANAQMSKQYGHFTTAEIRDIVAGTGKELHRVIIPGGLMAFKWNDHDQKLDKMLGLMEDYWEPLFGHKTSSRTKHASQTYWVMLRRKDLLCG